MDGPEHYQRADASFEKARKAGAASDGASAVLHLQAAQFHATMALAAAAGQLVQLNGQGWANIIARWDKAFGGELELNE